jgi:hypothetical protein
MSTSGFCLRDNMGEVCEFYYCREVKQNDTFHEERQYVSKVGVKETGTSQLWPNDTGYILPK